MPRTPPTCPPHPPAPPPIPKCSGHSRPPQTHPHPAFSPISPLLSPSRPSGLEGPPPRLLALIAFRFPPTTSNNKVLEAAPLGSTKQLLRRVRLQSSGANRRQAVFDRLADSAAATENKKLLQLCMCYASEDRVCVVGGGGAGLIGLFAIIRPALVPSITDRLTGQAYPPAWCCAVPCPRITVDLVI